MFGTSSDANSAKNIINDHIITRNKTHFKKIPPDMEIPIHLQQEGEIEMDFPNHDKPNDQPSVQPETSQRTRKTYPKRIRQPAEYWKKY